MIPLFSLGDLYVSNFIPMNHKSEDYPKGKLELCLDDEMVRLSETVDYDVLYKNYWYNSGTNDSMKKELSDIVQSVLKTTKINTGDVWLDIGCNDGTLLEMVPDNIIRVGCDPSNSIDRAIKSADYLIKDYFSYQSFKQKSHKRAKSITAIAMFYDLEDPKEFLDNVYDSLADDGIFVIQISYLPLMLKQLAFDNICHEHLYYYSLQTIKKLFEDSNFTIVDCILNDTNGGSFRVYAKREDSLNYTNTFATGPYRDVAEWRINSLLDYEQKISLTETSTYKNFFSTVEKLKTDVCDFIHGEVKKGKKIWGYGASTKGNTLLQYFNLDSSLIQGIAERQSIKYGLKTIGSEISIYSEHDMRKANPDYLLVLPWHFIAEFQQREQEFLKNGGKFIVPCPKFEVIGL